MKSVGIVPFPSFIFGFDEDTEDSFRLTLEFLIKERIGLAAFWILTPLPGTDLYDDFKCQNRIVKTDWSLYDGTNLTFVPKILSAQQLQNLYWRTSKKYFSLSGIWRNSLGNIRTSNRFLDEVMRNLFYQPYFWWKVKNNEHPFSGGIGKRMNNI
jgi:radical SAM superfamily enzyme YgiQ (UPF0313 family)